MNEKYFLQYVLKIHYNSDQFVLVFRQIISIAFDILIC
jgi:hypothetical protein